MNLKKFLYYVIHNFLIFLIITSNGFFLFTILSYGINLYSILLMALFSLISLFMIKKEIEMLLGYYKGNYFSKFGGWKYKVISNLFFEYPYDENLIPINNNMKELKVPKLFRNILNLNEFNIEIEKKKWKNRQRYYYFEKKGIKKFIPKKRITSYEFINYKFTSNLKDQLVFSIFSLKISKIFFMVLSVPSNTKFADLINLGIKMPTFYSSKLPIPSITLSQILDYKDTIMQYKEGFPLFFNYSKFLAFKEFSKDEIERFNNIIKNAYLFEFLNEIEDFSDFELLFQAPILSEIKYETPRIISLLTGKEKKIDPYIYYFSRSLSEQKALQSLLESFYNTFDFWGDYGRIFLTKFIKYLIWINPKKISIKFNQRNRLIENLYSVMDNIQINFKAYLELYNLTHYYLYEEREEIKKEDQLKGDSLGVYLNLLRMSIDFLNSSVHNRIREHYDTEHIPEYSYLDDLQMKIIYIKDKLEKNYFKNCLRVFNEALEVYGEKRIASIVLLRRVFECIVNEITRKNEGRKYSLHKNLQILENKKIIMKTLGNPRDTHLEKNFSHKLYGLLSYYGSHDNPYEPEIANLLFYLTIYWIYLILRRYSL